jgi:hypothetical protein
MATLDVKLQTTVQNLLKKQGAQITLRKNAVTQNASQPWTKDSAAVTNQTPYAIVSNYSVYEQGRDGAIRSDDRRFFMEAKTLTSAPEVGDQIVVGSDIFNIIDVVATAHVPNGVVISYECRGRR